MLNPERWVREAAGLVSLDRLQEEVLRGQTPVETLLTQSMRLERLPERYLSALDPHSQTAFLTQLLRSGGGWGDLYIYFWGRLIREMERAAVSEGDFALWVEQTPKDWLPRISLLQRFQILMEAVDELGEETHYAEPYELEGTFLSSEVDLGTFLQRELSSMIQEESSRTSEVQKAAAILPTALLAGSVVAISFAMWESSRQDAPKRYDTRLGRLYEFSLCLLWGLQPPWLERCWRGYCHYQDLGEQRSYSWHIQDNLKQAWMILKGQDPRDSYGMNGITIQEVKLVSEREAETLLEDKT